MSNTSNTRATKGSKFLMQAVANDDTLTARLETLLGERLQWISPLEAESFKEYQLKEPKISSDVLGLSRNEFKANFSFWATNQPHWDAIAVSEKILYLFEAKAHVKETFSKITATNPDSVKKISASMRKVFDDIADVESANFEAWTGKFYQLGNRLTFVHFMNRMTLPKINRVELVLLNFTDDKTHIPTTKADWTRHYEKIFCEMLGRKSPPPNVRVIYF